jgi:hypothetical protein
METSGYDGYGNPQGLVPRVSIKAAVVNMVSVTAAILDVVSVEAAVDVVSINVAAEYPLPAKPVARVWVSNGYLMLDPHCAGFQTCAVH